MSWREVEAEKYRALLDDPEYYQQNHGFCWVDMVPPGDRLLEIGFGNGSFLRAMRAQGRDVFGVEIVPELCTQPWHKVGTACSIPAAPYSFDVVCAFDVMEHIPRDRLDASLGEIQRVLHPSGWVMLRIAFHEDPPYHLIVEPEEWWADQLCRVFPSVQVVEDREAPGRASLFIASNRG